MDEQIKEFLLNVHVKKSWIITLHLLWDFLISDYCYIPYSIKFTDILNPVLYSFLSEKIEVLKDHVTCSNWQKATDLGFKLIQPFSPNQNDQCQTGQQQKKKKNYNLGCDKEGV